MRKLFAGMILGGVAALGAAPAHAVTVVELFQSQGCSSCPPAIRNVNALADRPDILALTFAVTYWDQLGWKDTFARPDFTRRQYDYAKGLHHDGVYTPQVVINGRSDMTGVENPELLAAVGHAAATQGPEISASGNSVTVAAGSGSGDVWLVRYDPRVLNIAIGAGENSGVTIAHRDIVRDLVRLGGWTGAAQSYAVPQASDAAWRSAILVQGRNGGAILSARKL